MSRSDLPPLTQFRLEDHDKGLVHLVFDCPDRPVNIFSNQAIHELGTIAEWLHASKPKGLLVRSGKTSGFCAGADLTELGIAYDMIVAAPLPDRFDIAFDHFFPLSHALRRLETADVPIAAAIGGVALGGGCELAMAAHYRVMGHAPGARLGLPECQVGLLPGAGGTQRMPRLIGADDGLEVLLQGRTLAGEEARAAGIVDALAEPGGEVAAAEEWLLSPNARAVQPWDQPDHQPASHSDYAVVVEQHRKRQLHRMLGHEPAPVAILDCVEAGLMQPMDGAIRTEMSVFARLIARPEPRNMIRTLFLGKQAYDKAVKREAVPSAVKIGADALGELLANALAQEQRLQRALFGSASGEPVQDRAGAQMWLAEQADLLAALEPASSHAASLASRMPESELLQLDHLVVRRGDVPAYLGGVTGLAQLVHRA